MLKALDAATTGILLHRTVIAYSKMGIDSKVAVVIADGLYAQSSPVTRNEKQTDGVIIMSKELLRKVREMSPDAFAVWKHYEERADHLGEQLWSTGAWLIALVGATLSLPFVAKLVTPLPASPFIQVENRVAVAIIALFGILLCGYSYHAVRDLREHIESNWRKSGYILDGSWQANWKGRKNHGWTILLVIGALALVGFALLFILAIAGVRKG
jgi:hypothetical protein